MGPCVRLIRALVAQPDKCKEENKTQWEEFKNTVKSVGWKLTEQKIVVPAPDETRDNGLVESYSTTINVGRLTPITDNDQSLVGKATMTYDDGTTEEVHVVHHWYDQIPLGSASNSVKTRLLTSTKNIDLSWYVVDRRHVVPGLPTVGWGATGTAITTASDGTKSLSHLRRNEAIYPIPYY